MKYPPMPGVAMYSLTQIAKTYGQQRNGVRTVRLMTLSSCIAICAFAMLTAMGWTPNNADANGRKDRFYFERRGDAVWNIPTGKKAIALTFDDGPDPVYTPQLLEILKHNHAHATFFVIGKQAKKYPSIIQREVHDGHQVENHTFTHQYLRHKPDAVIAREIQDAQDVIRELTHQQSRFFRPPGGYYDEHIIHAAKRSGYTVVLWSWDEDSRDWTDPGIHKIVQMVVRHADDGDIVLLHDRGGKRKQTVDAIKTIVPLLQAQGFEFVTISEMLERNKRWWLGKPKTATHDTKS